MEHEHKRHPYPFTRYSVTEIPPLYRHLRENEPVARVDFPSGDEGWVVSRFDDAYALLADQRFSRAATADPDAPRLTSARPVSGGLFTMDPPEHTRLRRLVAKEFTARRINGLRPRIQRITDELLDGMERGGRPADLIRALAFPLPVRVICELLGVPFSDHDKFQAWSEGIVSLTSHTEDEALHDMASLAGYFQELIAAKRTDGTGDDLLSALVRAEEEERLSEHELMMMGMTLLVAGHETTATVIGSGALSLLRHPEALRTLQESPERIDDIVEEILRVNPIGDGGPLRVTLEEVEIAGTVIPENAAVVASVPGANHDHRHFDSPHTFDIDRADKQHMAFGHGVHYCIGAALARAELQISLSTLFRRFPNLALDAEAEDLEMTSGMMVHSLRELPVTW
ncbi:cytochrome P450 [Streptomonospora salina]|uniref:Cytochrome P450 n=1 Tax=Streptomonospora salina TaxID=104205 RepID=A0A841EFA6_9ACTN|nr:cytochrome P450 [Streptomonospora salina]MBB6001004.1 cytochrome P450 [Streptomonospora salina]